MFTIDPLTDARWGALVERHRRGTVFHSSGWLSALRRTYAYEPAAFTTCAPGEALTNALVFCNVKSWITGRRLVSLPFSDHCDVLADSPAERDHLLARACECVGPAGCARAEFRPLTVAEQSWPETLNLQPSKRFWLHRVPLDIPLDTLFRNLHKNCIQRKIRRTERERLIYEKGRSEILLRKFFDLLVRTRKRQYRPPQPLQWFRNLAESMGENLVIRLVSKEDRPVAAILTLSHQTTVTYKYGCSDERFHSLGGTPFLFWKAMQESKNDGMLELDLGRSDLDHAGLVEFKDRLGAIKTSLTYWQYPAMNAASVRQSSWRSPVAKTVFSWIPDSVLVASGRFLYRHMG